MQGMQQVRVIKSDKKEALMVERGDTTMEGILR